MRYQVRPRSVEAERFYPSQPLPFADEGIVNFGCLCAQGDGCSFCDSFWVSTNAGQRLLTPGDYIVRDDEGIYTVMSPNDFADRYEVRQ